MKTTPIPASVRWASLSILVGLVFLFAGMTSRTTAGTTDVVVVPLHNDRAEPGDDCPDAGPSWHFVIAPNNGTFRFESISLLVGGTLYSFEQDDLIRNGGQQDNVFVLVPDGHGPTDLAAAGSFAEIAPPPVRPMLKFVLSSVCAGSTSTTTSSTSVPSSTSTSSTSSTSVPSSPPGSTTTSTSTTTTTPDSTTTSTTSPSSTTTSPSTTTTSTSSTTTSTTVPVTTTTVEQGGPPAPSTSTTTSTTAPTSTTSTTTSTSSTSSTSTTTTTLVVTTVARSMATTGTGGGRVMVLIGTVFLLIGGLALLASSRLGSER